MNHFYLVKTKFFCVFSLFTLVLLIGCASIHSDKNEEGNSTNLALTRKPVISETETPAFDLGENSITVVSTVLPQIITTLPEQTLTPTPLISPSPTPTFSPIATLSVEQEGVLLSKLMATNGGCMLPCWWGITPSLTHEYQARDIFELQGINGWTTSFDGTYALLGLGYPRKDLSVDVADINLRFQISNDIIQYIDVDGGYRQEEFRELFIRDWQLYEPDKMLEQYGLPEYIEFAKIENSPYYRLIFSYPLRGIEINYIVPFELIETDKVKVCFDLAHVDFIALSLYPSNQMENAPENIIPKRLSTYISWEETTGLTIDSFRQIFDNQAVLPCIELSLEP